MNHRTATKLECMQDCEAHSWCPRLSCEQYTLSECNGNPSQQTELRTPTQAQREQHSQEELPR